MTNNERKLKGIPLRRKIIHNKGLYKQWVNKKIDELAYKIMKEIICTRPYPTPISMLEKANEFNLNEEKLKRISKIGTETIRNNVTFRVIPYDIT